MGSIKQVLVAALAAVLLLTLSVTTTGATVVAAAEAAPPTLGAAAEAAALPNEVSHVEEEEADETDADEAEADVDATARDDRRRPWHRPRRHRRRHCRLVKICHRPRCHRRRRRFSDRTAVEAAGTDDDAAAGASDVEEVADGAALDAVDRDSRRHGRRSRCKRKRCFKVLLCRGRRWRRRH